MVLLTLLAVVTVAIVGQRSLFGVVILASIYSFLMASLLIVLDAVDVAMTEASVGAGVSSPAMQARYLERQGELLDSVDAILWLHLLFADPDLSTWPPPIPPNLPLFTSIGLCGSSFGPKPALAIWDELFGLPFAVR